MRRARADLVFGWALAAFLAGAFLSSGIVCGALGWWALRLGTPLSALAALTLFGCGGYFVSTALLVIRMEVEG